MKNRLSTIFIITISVLLMAFQCDDDNEMTKEDEQIELIAHKKIIEDLVATSICNENTECKFIAFGSKPCGGPWGYLVYSTSIDTKKLESLIANYNKKERAFNLKWGIISDCSVALPPTNTICENNKCVAVY